jgi:hypothetical protein
MTVSGGPVTSALIIRRRHPLEGQSLWVLGRMRRHGRLELLLVLPDGSKRLIPQAWTDQADDGAAGDGVATLGTVADLLATAALVGDLVGRTQPGQGQAACQSPSKEDSHAACPAQFATRPASGDTSDAGRAAAGRGRRHGDHVAGCGDRQGQSREGGGRR